MGTVKDRYIHYEKEYEKECDQFYNRRSKTAISSLAKELTVSYVYSTSFKILKMAYVRMCLCRDLPNNEPPL